MREVYVTELINLGSSYNRDCWHEFYQPFILFRGLREQQGQGSSLQAWKYLSIIKIIKAVSREILLGKL